MPEALVISDVSYAGEAASPYITQAIIGLDTFDKGVVYVKDGIKKSLKIKRIDVSGIFQKRKATPVSKGTINVDGRDLIVEDMMVYFEWNPRDFEDHWDSQQLAARLLDAELPADAESKVMMLTSMRMAEGLEKMAWRARKQYDVEGSAVDPTTKGDTAEAVDFFYFDGFLKKMLDDSTVVDVGSPVTLTYSNIRAELTRAIKLLPFALIGDFSKVSILMGKQDFLKYDQALREDTYKNQDSTATSSERFAGYPIKVLSGIPENTFVITNNMATADSNLWVGLNSVDDSLFEINKVAPNSELWFLKALMKIDVNHGWGAQTVLYTSFTA